MPEPLEKDMRPDYVVPGVEVADWRGRFVEEYHVTEGKIVPVPLWAAASGTASDIP